MKAAVLSVALVLVFGGSAAAQRAELAKARAAYNQQQFDEAIDAAQVARKFPATSDAATVVLARAYLERYRQRANPGDLAAARVSLGTVRVTNLDSRDHVDFLMALGEALFFEDEFGAAAALFESSIDSAIAQGPGTGEAMLDWWGSAIERQADALEREQRAAVVRPPARPHGPRAGQASRLRRRRLLGRRRHARRGRPAGRLGCRRRRLGPGQIGRQPIGDVARRSRQVSAGRHHSRSRAIAAR